MAQRLRKRLTFANVIAVIALFVALGGSVYAASRINGRTIRPSSVPGNRLKKNTVTGTQVNEATLGLVPRAAKSLQAEEADHAAQASDASAVNGVSIVKISSRQPSSTPATTILDLAGLKLSATCSGAGNLDLIATTTKQTSSIYMQGTQTDTNQPADDYAFDLEGGAFGPSTPVNVSTQLGGGGNFPIVGTIAYDNPDGSEATVNLALDISGGGGAGSKCIVIGTAAGG